MIESTRHPYINTLFTSNPHDQCRLGDESTLTGETVGVGRNPTLFGITFNSLNFPVEDYPLKLSNQPVSIGLTLQQFL